MKTVREKAIKAIVDWRDQANEVEIHPVLLEKLILSVMHALVEQDRDTRHACASDCNQLKIPVGLEDMATSYAHNACMNCNGGLKTK